MKIFLTAFFAVFCSAAGAFAQVPKVTYNSSIPAEGIETGLARQIEIGIFSVQADTLIKNIEVVLNPEFKADQDAFGVLSLFEGPTLITSDNTNTGNDGRFQVNHYVAEPRALKLVFSASNFDTAPFLKMTLTCRFENDQELVIDVPLITLNLDFADFFYRGVALDSTRIIPLRMEPIGRFDFFAAVDPDFVGEKFTVTPTFRIYPSRTVSTAHLAAFTLVYITSDNREIVLPSAYAPLVTVRNGSTRYFKLQFKTSVSFPTLGNSPIEGRFEVRAIARKNFPRGGAIRVTLNPTDQPDFRTSDGSRFRSLARDEQPSDRKVRP